MSAETMTVTRVRTDHGSHIDPPFDHTWDDLTKLCWHAGVTAADTGLQVSVSPAYSRYKPNRWSPWITEHGVYNVNIGYSTCGPMNYDRAWAYLNGVSAGAEAVRRSA